MLKSTLVSAAVGAVTSILADFAIGPDDDDDDDDDVGKFGQVCSATHCGLQKLSAQGSGEFEQL